MRFGNYNLLCGPNNWGDSFWGIPFLHGPFGFVLSLLFWAIVIWAFLKVFQAVFNVPRQKNDSDPLMILKRRYACGEITLDEFNSIKKEL